MPIETLNPPGLPTPDVYCQVAVATGSRTVYLAGQVARTADGEPVGPGDLAAQTAQAFANVHTALAAVDASRQDDHRDLVEQTYRREVARYVALARLLTGNAPGAEDIVQEVFAGLYRRETPLADPERITSYLTRAVVNRARSLHRRQRHHAELSDDVHPLIDSAERRALANGDRAAVLAALATLPLRQRECAVCHFLLDLTQAEVAHVLGMNLGTVKTHLRRASASLTRQLEGRR